MTRGFVDTRESHSAHISATFGFWNDATGARADYELPR